MEHIVSKSKMSKCVQHDLPGWAHINLYGFTMNHIEDATFDWNEQITSKTKLIIQIDDSSYEHTSENGFVVRQIYGLMNDDYVESADGDIDEVGHIALNGFKIIKSSKSSITIKPIYST